MMKGYKFDLVFCLSLALCVVSAYLVWIPLGVFATGAAILFLRILWALEN